MSHEVLYHSLGIALARKGRALVANPFFNLIVPVAYQTSWAAHDSLPNGAFALAPREEREVACKNEPLACIRQEGR